MFKIKASRMLAFPVGKGLVPTNPEEYALTV